MEVLNLDARGGVHFYLELHGDRRLLPVAEIAHVGCRRSVQLQLELCGLSAHHGANTPLHLVALLRQPCLAVLGVGLSTAHIGRRWNEHADLLGRVLLGEVRSQVNHDLGSVSAVRSEDSLQHERLFDLAGHAELHELELSVGWDESDLSGLLEIAETDAVVERRVVDNDGLLSTLNLGVLAQLSVLRTGETIVQHECAVWHSGDVAVDVEFALNVRMQHLPDLRNKAVDALFAVDENLIFVVVYVRSAVVGLLCGLDGYLLILCLLSGWLSGLDEKLENFWVSRHDIAVVYHLLE